MNSVVSVPASCPESFAKEDLLATFNQMEGSFTEIAIAPPDTSRFAQAYYFKGMTGATLAYVLKQKCNVSFAVGLTNLPSDIIEGKLQKRIGSDQYIAQKNIISFDIDFKTFVSDYDSKTPNKGELAFDIFNDLKLGLDQAGIPLWLGVFSGNGIHLHFKLKDPVAIESKKQYQEIYEAILGYLSCQIPKVEFDPACKNPSRLMRFPFTTNWKDVANPIPTQILFHDVEADFGPTYAKFVDALKLSLQIKHDKSHDKKSILNKLTLVKILDHFKYSKKLSISEKGSQVVCSSPFTQDSSPSFYCDLSKKVFYDFSSSFGGDYFTLIAKLANVDSHQEFPKVLSIARKIAGIEEKVFSGTGFSVDNKGVWFQADLEAEKEWLSSPLQIEALTRDEKSQAWGRLLRFQDQDGVSKTWPMPMDLLAGDGIELRRQLLALGLRLALGKRERGLFLSYLQSAEPQARIKSVERMGWHNDCFVLPNETISSNQNHDEVVIQSQLPKNEILTKGTLEEWQDHIGSKCIGNSRLILGVCAALATPLVKHVMLENGGFHFVGSSSIGKSIALKVAASVWGNPGLNGFIKRWRSTINGLELLALSRCDSLLILDELGEIQPKDAGLAAYTLGSGQSKSRSSANGTLLEQKEWRILFLSSGEIGLTTHINSDGCQARAGQEVRLVDIPADAESGFGIFENIFSCQSPKQFAIELNQNAEKFYGTPIVSFIKKLRASSNCLSNYEKHRKVFFDSIDLMNSHGQIHRVAERFALLASAGELAIEFGVLKWPQGEALSGTIKCFKDWKREWGGESNKESRQIIQHIRTIFQEHGSARFPQLSEHKMAHQGNLWGFKRENQKNETEWLVLNEIFRKEFCRDFEYRNVIQALKEFDLIRLGQDLKSTISARVPFLGVTRVVVISEKILA